MWVSSYVHLRSRLRDTLRCSYHLSHSGQAHGLGAGLTSDPIE